MKAGTDFLQRYNRTPSVEEAKSTPIHLLDDAKEEAVKPCTAFDCFGYELSLNERADILSSGTWYEVVGAFVTRTNQVINRIAAPTLTLPAWNQKEKEGAYNLRCASAAGFLHFDVKNIMFGGGQSKFEFCDLLHEPTNTLLFVKIASKSSGMSHLVQ